MTSDDRLCLVCESSLPRQAWPNGQPGIVGSLPHERSECQTPASLGQRNPAHEVPSHDDGDRRNKHSSHIGCRCCCCEHGLSCSRSGGRDHLCARVTPTRQTNSSTSYVGPTKRTPAARVRAHKAGATMRYNPKHNRHCAYEAAIKASEGGDKASHRYPHLEGVWQTAFTRPYSMMTP